MKLRSEAAVLASEKGAVQEASSKLKHSLAEALSFNAEGRPRVNTDSPADLAIRLMEAILSGEEVSYSWSSVPREASVLCGCSCCGVCFVAVRSAHVREGREDRRRSAACMGARHAQITS